MKCHEWRPRLASRARLRFDQIGDQEMLLFSEAGLALNETAAAILRLCDGEKSMAQIVEHLHANYPDAGRNALETEVKDFLNRLRVRGILV